MNPTPPPRRLQPGDYVWQWTPSGPGYQQPGVVTSLRPDPGWVFVHWLHDVTRSRIHPMPTAELVYAEHDPDLFGVLEDADGAPLPDIVQQGGQVWHAVLFGLRASTLRLYAIGSDLGEAADNVMVTLAPILGGLTDTHTGLIDFLRRFTRPDNGPGWPGTEETMVHAGQLLTRLGDTCTPDHVGPIITPPGTTDRYCLTCQAEPITTTTNPPPDPNHENPNTPHPTTNPQEPTP